MYTYVYIHVYIYLFICTCVYIYIKILVHTLVLMQMALDLPPSLESAPHARLISIEKKPGERLKGDPYRILPSTDSVTH